MIIQHAVKFSRILVLIYHTDTSEKECCVTYGLCDRREHKSTQTCNRNSPYNIQLEVADRSRYCYTITASNESHTVKLEGIFTLGIVQFQMFYSHP